MKEFGAQTGGRYTYADDVLNLQDLALAFASIFTGCENFIINGCTISGTTISAGYVYINGKIRYFGGATGVAAWPGYIYESNSTESVAYASGTTKVGRNIYGCSFGSSVPTTPDPITGNVPQYIAIPSTGGLLMKDALFGKYSLLLDAASANQTVNGVVNFANTVNIAGLLTGNGGIAVNSGTCLGKMFWDSQNFIIQSRVGDGTLYKLIVTPSNGFKFFAGETEILNINSNGQSTAKPISTSSSITAGAVKMDASDLYEAASNDVASLKINMKGYAGGTTQFRNTIIGDGKGVAIISVTGSSKTIDVGGTMVISGSSTPIIIKGESTDSRFFDWKNSQNSELAYLGYKDVDNDIFKIVNAIGDIEIAGAEYVDLGPAIKEGGVSLSTKYVLKSAYDTAMAGKADSNNVFTKTEADGRFAKLSSGLSQFLVGTTTSAILRNQIGALGSDNVGDYCPTLVNCLSDMATSDTKKAQIRANIGAAPAGSYQDKLYDSGWKTVITGRLYARQVGTIVTIQGLITTASAGTTLFTLPNQIDPPKYVAAFYGDISGVAMCHAIIAADSRSCVVERSATSGDSIYFTLVYMTA